MLKKMILSSLIFSTLLVTSSYAEPHSAPALPSTPSGSSSSSSGSSTTPSSSSSSSTEGGTSVTMTNNDIEIHNELTAVNMEAGGKVNMGLTAHADNIEISNNDIEIDNEFTAVNIEAEGDINIGVDVGR